jgi:hypothetical protein
MTDTHLDPFVEPSPPRRQPWTSRDFTVLGALALIAAVALGHGPPGAAPPQPGAGRARGRARADSV